MRLVMVVVATKVDRCWAEGLKAGAIPQESQRKHINSVIVMVATEDIDWYVTPPLRHCVGARKDIHGTAVGFYLLNIHL